MDASKDRGSIPEQFERTETAADIWGMSGLTDHRSQPCGVGIDACAPWRVVLDPSVGERVISHARIRGVSPETLIGLCLMEWTQG
jgi:hypothetical protein